jgi:hypothetical protein
VALLCFKTRGPFSFSALSSPVFYSVWVGGVLYICKLRLSLGWGLTRPALDPSQPNRGNLVLNKPEIASILYVLSMLHVEQNVTIRALWLLCLYCHICVLPVTPCPCCINVTHPRHSVARMSHLPRLQGCTYAHTFICERFQWVSIQRNFIT